MSALLPVLVILLMVAVNALYVAAEFATVGSRKSRVQEAAERGNRNAAGLLAILQDPARVDTYVAACQIGITLSSLIAGAYGQAQLTPLLTPVLGAVGGPVVATILVLVLITALQVVLGELLPKTVALRYPERLAVATLRPMQVSLWLFRPLIALFNGTAFRLMRAWGLNADHSHAHVHSPEELEDLYRESARGGLIDAAERDMVAGVLNVEDRVVREIMTPRTRMVTVPAHLPAEDALRRLAPTSYTRFPVTGDNPDDVIGVVNLRQVFLLAERRPGAWVGDVMRPPLIVAESMAVPDLWRRLREASRHSALVVDEYGSVAGLVTLEDALEEIFGEVQDEFDHEEEPILVQGERVSVRGDVLVEALNDRFDLELPTDEVDTVSGLMWQELGRLPVVGDEVGVENLTLRVEAMERRAVQRVSFLLPSGSTDREDWGSL
ncbi:hemolysin family protein [Deinococcus sp. MIMF12]|uniref:Hemolysin family protein n=1 Tax=Deinococcus rhizophilus TaxID=3049544 RepID=A0ABT7JK76_9DEIO|nr:hemolysin family protein [Deinococcus rhizophilus]MDL2345460.1 hemolysin family protein [Deinococcus rhizophilus]